MPADPHRAVILRRIEAVDGSARVRVVLDVRAGFGRSGMTELARAGGCWTGRSGRMRFRWSGAARARAGADGLVLTVTLPAGGHHDLVLELSDRPLPERPPDPDEAWEATENTWSTVVPRCDDLMAARDARHAYAVLRGLTAGSGAMVAAATTSLPERLEGGRNYDYRYAWIRDQCYGGLAIAAHGPRPAAGRDAAVPDRADPDRRARSHARLHRLRAAHSRGTPGAGTRLPGRGDQDRESRHRPVPAGRAGGGARAVRRGGPAGPAHRGELAGGGGRGRGHRAALGQARGGHLGARRPALDALPAHLRVRAALAGRRGRGRPAAPGTGRRPGGAGWPTRCWPSLGNAVHATGRWQRTPEDPRVDAALLLPVIRGTLPADDPRNRATVQAVLDELTEDGYVYRFRHDARPLHESEGAFLLCGFWMAQVAQVRGDADAAARWFERNRAACGPAGLYTEEYDVRQRQSRGNLPQAFVHAGLLECAARLSSAPAGPGQLG